MKRVYLSIVILLINLTYYKEGYGEESTTLIEKAKNYYKEQKYKEAKELFLKAYELSQDPKLLFNLGLCSFMLEEYFEATNLFSEFLEKAKNIPKDIKETAERRLKDAKERFSLVELDIIPAHISCELYINGERYKECPPQGPFPLNQGNYFFKIISQGFKTKEKSVEVKGGGKVVVELELVPEEPKEKDEVDQKITLSERSVEKKRYKFFPEWAFWTLASITGGIIISSVITAILELNQYNYYKDEVYLKKPLEVQKEEYDKLNNLVTGTDILVGLGIGLSLSTLVFSFFTKFE